jgi:hypothetical protein
LAILINFTANAVCVEDISFRAFNTVAVSPILASKIVVDYFDEVGVIVFWA